MDKEQLKNKGWQFGSISSGAHLQRTVATYRELGFEVYVEKIDLSQENQNEAGCGTGCTVCYENPAEPPYRIYYRNKTPSIE
jgi:hypothetical protein